jgi:hypothetical protein
VPAFEAGVSPAVVGALFRSGERVVRTARLALVVVAATVTVLALLAAGIVGNAYRVEAVREARTPVLAQSPSDVIAEVVMRGPVWGDEQFPLVWVQPVEPTAPPPPGLSTWPEAGHVVVSPGLLARPEIIDGFGLELSTAGTGVDGTIGDDGILTRSELLAYAAPPVGRDLGPGGARLQISGFGLPLGSDGGILLETDPDYPSPLAAATGSLLFIAVPSATLLAAAIRIRAPARRRRTDNLWLLGVSRRQVRAVLLLETVLLVAPGTVAGILVGGFILPHLRSLPLTGWELAPGALVPSATASLVAVLVTVLLASGMAVAHRTSRKGTGRQLRRAPSLLADVLGLSILVGSLATLAVAGSSRGPWVTAVLWATLLVLSLGWSSSTQAVIRMLSRLHGHQWTSPSEDLSRRQLAHGAAPLAALVAPLGLVVLLSGAVLSIVATASGPVHSAGVEADDQIVLVSWRDPQPGDLAVLSDGLGPAVALVPVMDGVATTGDCGLASSFVDLPESVCDSAEKLPTVVSETWRRLTGLEVRLVPAGAWAPSPPSADVLIRGTSIATAYRVAFDYFTAPDVYYLYSGTRIVQPVANWLRAGIVSASAIASLAALVRFADLAMASGSGRERLESAGVPREVARSIRLRVTRMALLASTVTAAAYALIFSWAGIGAELTTVSLSTVGACFLAVSAPGLVLLYFANRYGRG